MARLARDLAALVLIVGIGVVPQSASGVAGQIATAVCATLPVRCSAQVVVRDLDVERARHVGLDHLGDGVVPARFLGR